MCYFDNAIKRTQLTVESICHELKNPKLGEVDLVVGIGFSGTLLLAAIHIQSGIPFGAIRKDSSGTHSSRTVEVGGLPDLKNVRRYVIIDDFTESGDTIECIKIVMSGYDCVGIIFYQEMKFNSVETLNGFPNVPIICLATDIEEIMLIRHAEKETCCV